MANLLSRISAPLLRSLRPLLVKGEGSWFPGPYNIQYGGTEGAGWLPAGSPINYWQTGQSLRPQGGANAMVEACVSAYSQTIASCPGDHWRSLGNGGRERVTNSDLCRILRQPNDYQSISDFLLNLTRNLYLNGEAFALVIRNNRGEVDEIHLMRQGIATIATDGSIFYGLQGNEVVQERYDLTMLIPARDVLHVRLHTPQHPLRGVSPILANAMALQMSGAVFDQQISYYINQARPSFILESDVQMNKTQRDELRKEWNDITQGPNAGGSPILTWGLKAKPVTMTAVDGQLAELLKLNDQGIALAFRIPLQVLGVGGTPFASTEALMQSWKSQGLGFCLNHIEEAFGLLFRLVGQPNEYVEFNTEALLRSAFKERIDGLAAGVMGGIISSDEARSQLELPKTPGGVGAQPRVQQQLVPLSYGAEMQPPDPNANKPPPSSDSQSPPTDEAQTKQLILRSLRASHARHAA
jgi:HK97 family phage portal protein